MALLTTAQRTALKCSRCCVSPVVNQTKPELFHQTPQRKSVSPGWCCFNLGYFWKQNIPHDSFTCQRPRQNKSCRRNPNPSVDTETCADVVYKKSGCGCGGRLRSQNPTTRVNKLLSHRHQRKHTHVSRPASITLKWRTGKLQNKTGSSQCHMVPAFQTQ